MIVGNSNGVDSRLSFIYNVSDMLGIGSLYVRYSFRCSKIAHCRHMRGSRLIVLDSLNTCLSEEVSLIVFQNSFGNEKDHKTLAFTSIFLI